MLSWDQSSSIALMQRERAWVEIDLTALAHNIDQIRSLLLPHTDLMAVVKADAYGHGAVTVAQTVLQAGATWLGVATIPEGIELREAGIEAPILVMGATHTAEQIRAIADWNLQPTLCTPKQALVFSEAMGQSLQRQPLPVHIKLDTGMSRLGTPCQKAVEFVQLVQGLPGLAIASIYSHLATADDPDPYYSCASSSSAMNTRFKPADFLRLSTLPGKCPLLGFTSPTQPPRSPMPVCTTTWCEPDW